MSSATHTINVLVQQQGLDQVQSAMQQFTQSTGTATQSQDALGQAMGKTQGAAFKTGTEIEKVGQKTTTTSKSTTSLGQAFKSSALQIGAFVSGLISTVMQVNSVLAAENKLEKMREGLEKRNASLELAELKYRTAIDNGSLSGEKARLQGEKLSATRNILELDTEKLRLKEEQHSASILQTALTAIPTVINAFGSLSQIYSSVKSASDLVTEGSNTTGESLDALGTAADAATTTGIIPTFTSLGKLVTGAKSAKDALGDKGSGLVGSASAVAIAFEGTQKSGNVMINAFKSIGSAVKTFFSTMVADVGSATGVIDKIKAGFGSFFTQIGTGFKGLGGHLKTAGAAFVAFGKTLLGVFMSNPILLIIGAITVAVGALIFDLGGFRTRLNEIGVAIGKAVPALKPLLDGLGWFGMKLGEVGDFLMGTSAEMDNTALSATEMAAKIGPAAESLQELVDVGANFEKLDAAVAMFDNLRTAVEALTTTTVKGSTDHIAAMAKINTAWTTMKTTIKDASPATVAAIAAIDEGLRLYAAGLIKTKDFQTLFNTQLEYLNITAEKAVVADTNLNIAQEKVAQSAIGLSDSAANVVASFNEQVAAGEESTVTLTDNEKKVVELINSYGKAVPVAAEMTKEQVNLMNSLVAVAPYLEKYGEQLMFNSDNTVNWTATTAELTKKHQVFADQTGTDWSNITTLLEKGVAGYHEVESMIELVGVTDKERATAMQAALDSEMKQREANSASLSDMIDTALKGADAQAEAEKKSQDALEKSSVKIKEKAMQLGIWDDIQKLSTQTQETAIKVTEDAEKADAKAMTTLQKLATERGLNKSLLEQSSAAHLKYIANHDLEATTTDEVRSKLGELIAARQEDVKATELETESQIGLLTSMEKVPPVLDMTGKGLAGVVQAYDDTTNATGIAADSIGVWYAELDKTKAVHDATIVKLKELAEAEGITVPQAIMDQGIPAIKAYIENIKGVGDAAVKMKEDTLKAFEEMNSKGQDMLGSLLDEAILEGDSKEIKDILDEIGLEADNLVAVQRILTVTVDDTDFTNDISGLSEIMLTEFEKMTGFSQTEANNAVNMYSQEMVDEFGKQNPKMGDAINQVWEYVKANAPAGATGDFLLHAFGEAVKDPTIVTAALDGSLVVPTTNATAAATEAAGTGAASIPPAIAESIFGGASTIQNATLGGVVTPITGEIEKVPPNATTALAPVEGVFSAAFLAASVAATGVISQLLADITLSMGFLVTNIQEKLTEIETAWKTHGTNVAATIGELNITIVTVQETISELSSNVATYMGSMTTNIDNWASATGTSMGEVSTSANDTQGELSNMSSSVATYMDSMSSNVSDFESSFGTSMDSVITDAETATTAVEDLQSAIDALKDKTITITVNLEGAGVDHLKHGGSFINFGAPAHAQHGAAWIQKNPTKIGGTSISETFPEVVSVIPLDPKEKASPFYNLELPVKTPEIPTPTVIAGGGGGGGPTVTQGDVYVTVQLPNGEALARVVKPFMLTGYSGITSS